MIIYSKPDYKGSWIAGEYDEETRTITIVEDHDLKLPSLAVGKTIKWAPLHEPWDTPNGRLSYWVLDRPEII